MFLHITFSDGSNPYVKMGLKTTDDLRREVDQWCKSYDVCGYWVALGFMATATEKGAMV
jgi:hypothetical protein